MNSNNRILVFTVLLWNILASKLTVGYWNNDKTFLGSVFWEGTLHLFNLCMFLYRCSFKSVKTVYTALTMLISLLYLLIIWYGASLNFAYFTPPYHTVTGLTMLICCKLICLCFQQRNGLKCYFENFQFYLTSYFLSYSKSDWVSKGGSVEIAPAGFFWGRIPFLSSSKQHQSTGRIKGCCYCC